MPIYSDRCSGQLDVHILSSKFPDLNLIPSVKLAFSSGPLAAGGGEFDFIEFHFMGARKNSRP